MNQPKINHIGISEVQFGKNLTIVSPVNLYECVIGNNFFIGPFVEIQKDVKIGDRTKIQSHSFICELVDIGKDIKEPGVYAGNPIHLIKALSNY